MKKAFTLLLLALSSIFGYAQTIDPVLLQEMRQRTDDEKIKVIVIMKQQYDRQQLGRSAAHYTTRAERREFVVNELKQFAEASQYELRSTLSEMERQDMTTAPKVIYMANALYFSATRQAINDLAMRRDIELIGLDEKKHVLFDEEPRPANMARGITPNVTQVNADQVWAMGYTGQGVVVAVIDTGVNYNHLDLADHLWDGGSEYPYHGYNFAYDNNDPMDDNGHGTHCAGTVCGDGTAGYQTGMAPDATLMCVKVLDDWGYGYASVTCNAMQWAVEQGCDLFSMSLGWSGPTLTERMLFRNTCSAILDAGVIGAIAAGNNGYEMDIWYWYFPIPDNVDAPGSCPPPYMDPVQENNPGGLSCAFCVGAVDYNDEAAVFTSRGPVTWADTEYSDYPYDEYYVYHNSMEFGLIRPDVCAPGMDVISASYNGISGYTTMSGTSMAAPCVAGCISLLLSKNIDATPAEICQVLEETAVPLEEGKSNTYGYGRVDVLAAINALNFGPLTLESVAVNDEQGNNDGNLNAGESVTLDLTLLNDSYVALDGATMVLSTQSAFVTITNDTAALPHFDAGQTQTIENIFGFTLSNDAPANRAIQFTAETFVDGESISIIRMSVMVYGCILKFVEVTVLNDGNGNGKLEAGETADLHVVISNIGNESTASIVGTLSTEFPHLIINGTTGTFGDIEIGEQAFADFNVTLSSSAPESYIIDFSLNLVDDNGKHTNLEFEILEGIIVFADPYVKNICVSFWDTNYDGELSYDEAADVYYLGWAFSYNTEITLFNELQYFTGLFSIDDYAFNGCENLTSIILPNSITSIGNYAFNCCYGLTGSLTIPNSVVSIGNSAFYACDGLTALTIGNSVTSIGSEAFDCWGLNAVYYTGDIHQWCNIQFVNAGSDNFNVSSNPLYYAHNLYIDNELVTDLVIPETVTEIKAYAFIGATCLTSLTFPNSVTSIDSCAFYACEGLASLTLGDSVTSIGDYAFSYCMGLTGELTIPDAVTSIGEYAFINCYDFTSLTIGNSVTTIGNMAFYFCEGLTSATIGVSVASIGDGAFGLCKDLNAVYYTGDIHQWCNIQFDGYSANPLYYAHTLYVDNELVTNLVIPESVTEINPNAFCGAVCLTSLTIPNTVTSIGNYAFNECKGLTTLIIGNSVASIGDYAFRDCSNLFYITSLSENPPTTSDHTFGFSYSYIVSTPIVYVPCGFENDYASSSWGGFSDFQGLCGGMVTVVAEPEEGGTVIGNGSFEAGQTVTVTATANEGYVFANWTNNGIMVSNNEEYTFYVAGDMTLVAHFVPDENIVFADSNAKSICVARWDTNGDGELSYAEAAVVTNLDRRFRNNRLVTSFDELQYFIGLSSIDNYEFNPCTNLSSIKFPNSIISIGAAAFRSNGLSGCLIIPNSVISIGNGAFSFCRSLTSLNIGNSLISIGGGAFSGCDSLEQIIVEAGNTVYDSRENCNAIIKTNTNELEVGCKNTIIPNSVISIGASAFEDCTGLTSVVLPNSITSIGDYAFSGCSGLPSIEIPNSVTTIGISAFSYCSGLTSIEIPNSLTSIPGSAFSHCSGLTSIVLPNSITSIGDYAFSGCSGMTSMTVLVETPPSLGYYYVFSNVNKSIPVYIPCGTMSAYSEASGWNQFTNYQEILPYELSVSSSNTEMGTAFIVQEPDCGVDAVVQAVPIGDYYFFNWTEDGEIVSTDATYSFTLDSNRNLVANFSTPPFHFITPGAWGTASNWLNGALPGANDAVFIDAPCQLDQNATVAALTVSNGQSLTLQSGKTLTVTGNLTNAATTGMVIEDGAQLFHNVANVQATVRKVIIPFNSTSDGWHLIALPLTGNANLESVGHLVEGQYDLYVYDESTTYWKNSKTTESGFTTLETKKGYLYANGEEVTLEFSGTLENSSATITMPLSFTDGANLSGFNLIGNPFPCNAYLNREYYILTTDGTDINPEPIPATTPIPPCTAVFVKAVAEGDTVVFTRVAP